MTKRHGSIDTQLIHAGEIRPGIEGAVALPIFQCANFESVEGETYHDIKYMRLSNSPNHIVLGDKRVVIIEGTTGFKRDLEDRGWRLIEIPYSTVWNSTGSGPLCSTMAFWRES